MTRSKEERIKNADYAKSLTDGEYVKGVGGKIVLNFKVAIFLCTLGCLIFALAAPFILVLIQSAIKGYRLADMFVDFYRYFVLGGVFFVVLMVIEIYVFIRRKDLINNRQLGVLLTSVAVTILFSVLFGSYISP